MALNFSGPTGRWLKRFVKFGSLFLLIFLIYRLVHALTPSPPEVYRLGMDPDWYPLALYGKEHHITFFSTELLTEIAQDQDINIELQKVTHKRLFELLDQGLVDGILTSVLPDRNHLHRYDFSESYYPYGAVLVTKKGSSIRSLGDVENKRLGVKRSSPVLFRVPISAQVYVTPYDNFLMALHALSEGKVDAVLLDQLLFYVYFSPLYPGQLQVVTMPLTEEGLRLATLKGKEETLIQKFNSGLEDLKKKGTYQQLLSEWDLYHPNQLVQ